MDSKTNILKKIAGVAVSAGLVLATQDKKEIAVQVINTVAGNLIGNFIENAEYKKLTQLIHDTDPNDLNHDLKKLIVKSIEWAIKNIEILYKKNLTTNDEVKTLKDWNKNLIEEVRLLKSKIFAEEETLHLSIEKSDDSNEIFQLFEINVDQFPEIKKSNPYPEFFKKEFVPNLQLSFGELLKKEKNRPAYIAYQRATYQNLSASIGTLIQQNKNLANQLKQKETGLKNVALLEGLQRDIQSNNLEERILPEFEQVFNNRLSHIAQQTNLLVNITEEIKDDVKFIKGVTKDFGTELRRSWLQKNKVAVLTVFGIATAFILYLSARLTSIPFNMDIGLTVPVSINVHKQYPKLSDKAKLQVFLPVELEEKVISLSNHITLGNLERNLEGKTCKIQLIDPFWELSKDSIILDDSSLNLNIQPNERLSKIEGRVLSRDGQEQIENARIYTGSLETTSSSKGIFSMDLPIPIRKKRHTIRVEKVGYKTQELEYIAGSEIEVRLEKQQ